MENIFETLSDDELEWLDHFLVYRIDEDADCEGKDEGVLNVCELDGLLTAVVSGPVTIPPSHWMPQIWGDFPPAWKDERELQQVMSLLMRHMNSIAGLLMEQPGDFEPMFEGKSARKTLSRAGRQKSHESVERQPNKRPQGVQGERGFWFQTGRGALCSCKIRKIRYTLPEL